MNDRLTITDVAKYIGITPRTIMRWEKGGKIKKSKRDWRGWRFYSKEDLEEIRRFYESAYEYEEFEKAATNNNVIKNSLTILLVITSLFSSLMLFGGLAYSEATIEKIQGVQETKKTVDIFLDQLPVVNTPEPSLTEAVKYTLGPNDVIEIEVRRHPEFRRQITLPHL